MSFTQRAFLRNFDRMAFCRMKELLRFILLSNCFENVREGRAIMRKMYANSILGGTTFGCKMDKKF